jgi:hypothetical protein
MAVSCRSMSGWNLKLWYDGWSVRLRAACVGLPLPTSTTNHRREEAQVRVLYGGSFQYLVFLPWQVREVPKRGSPHRDAIRWPAILRGMMGLNLYAKKGVLLMYCTDVYGWRVLAVLCCKFFWKFVRDAIGMTRHLGRMISLESVRQRVAYHCLWLWSTFLVTFWKFYPMLLAHGAQTNLMVLLLHSHWPLWFKGIL